MESAILAVGDAVLHHLAQGRGLGIVLVLVEQHPGKGDDGIGVGPGRVPKPRRSGWAPRCRAGSRPGTRPRPGTRHRSRDRRSGSYRTGSPGSRSASIRSAWRSRTRHSRWHPHSAAPGRSRRRSWGRRRTCPVLGHCGDSAVAHRGLEVVADGGQVPAEDIRRAGGVGAGHHRHRLIRQGHTWLAATMAGSFHWVILPAKIAG